MKELMNFKYIFANLFNNGQIKKPFSHWWELVSY